MLSALLLELTSTSIHPTFGNTYGALYNSKTNTLPTNQTGHCIFDQPVSSVTVPSQVAYRKGNTDCIILRPFTAQWFTGMKASTRWLS